MHNWAAKWNLSEKASVIAGAAMNIANYDSRDPLFLKGRKRHAI